jgi:membrane fusion protein (multidrug efflux system)
MNNFDNIRAMALIVVLALGAGACQNSKAQEPAQGPAPAQEVGVVTIEPRPVSITVEMPGRTTPFLISDVRPQVNGIILKRLFEEGADIKAGQVLYQIDPATYQAAFDNAKAALAKDQANLVPAKLRAQRYGALIQSGSISKQDNDDAVAAARQAEASVNADKAALETARINLDYTKVTSPISGRIGRSAVTPGALVTASQGQALATVQQLDPIYVDVTRSSAELLRLKRDLASGLLKTPDQAPKVHLLLEDGTPYPQEGVLKLSEVTVEQSTGVITLRAVFPNPKNDLLPGMYVRAVLEEGVDDKAILVPQQAVIRDARGQASAMVVGEDDKVESRELKLDRAVSQDWLVKEGLKPGDRVIVDGLQKIRPGAPVKVASSPAVPATASAAGNPAQAQ